MSPRFQLLFKACGHKQESKKRGLRGDDVGICDQCKEEAYGETLAYKLKLNQENKADAISKVDVVMEEGKKKALYESIDDQEKK